MHVSIIFNGHVIDILHPTGTIKVVAYSGLAYNLQCYNMKTAELIVIAFKVKDKKPQLWRTGEKENEGQIPTAMYGS